MLTVWDVNTVISYMDTLPPNEKLSLKDLSPKLVMLMALCNADCMGCEHSYILHGYLAS